MKKTISIGAFGDISLCEKRCLMDPFHHVRNYLEEFDIVFGNLETVLTNESKHIVKSKNLLSDPINSKYLKINENSIYNIANNHMMDYFAKGFDDTIKNLEREKIKYIGKNQRNGFSNEQIFGIGEEKIAFVGYGICRLLSDASKYIARLNYDKIITHIKRLKNEGNKIIVVSIHDGEELIHIPHPRRQEISKILVDHGVKVVLWHHAHVPQGIEKYKNGIIAYSLGNFQFEVDEQKLYKWTHLTYILEIRITNEDIAYTITPIEIVNKIPTFPKRENEKLILDHINYLSTILKNNSSLLFYSVSSKIYLNCTLSAFIYTFKKHPIRSLRNLSWIVSVYFWKMILAYFFIPHFHFKKKYKNLYDYVYETI